MANRLKSYLPTWKGDLLLACRKCQKKLKHEPGMRGLAKLKKTIKRHNKEHPDALLHVISVGCMDLCPKAGVTICIPARQTFSILRNESEIEELYRQGDHGPRLDWSSSEPHNQLSVALIRVWRQLNKSRLETAMEQTHSDALVFFGATGDLAYKKIFPALQAMAHAAR